MPPKAKYTKEEIVAAAIDVIRADGIGSLTARSLGAKLGSSARPIFTVFQSMEEVRRAAIRAARTLYGKYIEAGLSQTPAFKGVGLQYIRFAREEPQLFQLLFLSEQEQQPDLSAVLNLIDDHYKEIRFSIQETYQLNQTEAGKLYRHLWIYTHGIAVLCVAKVCAFREAEIDTMLTEIFLSILQQIKTGGKA